MHFHDVFSKAELL